MHDLDTFSHELSDHPKMKAMFGDYHKDVAPQSVKEEERR